MHAPSARAVSDDLFRGASCSKYSVEILNGRHFSVRPTVECYGLGFCRIGVWSVRFRVAYRPLSKTHAPRLAVLTSIQHGSDSLRDRLLSPRKRSKVMEGHSGPCLHSWCFHHRWRHRIKLDCQKYTRKQTYMSEWVPANQISLTRWLGGIALSLGSNFSSSPVRWTGFHNPNPSFE